MSENVQTRARDHEAEWALIDASIARLRATTMAVVFGLASGTGLFIATIWLVIRGGFNVGATLGLLGNYFPGYTVTWGGAFIGFFYAAVVGAVLGFSVAYIYNWIVNTRHAD